MNLKCHNICTPIKIVINEKYRQLIICNTVVVLEIQTLPHIAKLCVLREKTIETLMRLQPH